MVILIGFVFYTKSTIKGSKKKIQKVSVVVVSTLMH